jgi:hypothetical protein
VGIKPFLEIRLGPGLVKPVTRVRNALASLLGDSVVVVADLLKKLITLAWLGNWDAVLVGKDLQLRIGPAKGS